MADARDSQSASHVSTGSGSLTATNQAVTLTLEGRSQASFQLTGTWVGTVTFEASNDNSNWTAIFAFRAGEAYTAQTATANEVYRCVVAGFAYCRARCSAYTSGTITVAAVASYATGGVFQSFAGQPLQVWKSANYTTTQTGAAIWTPASGKKVAIKYLAVSSYGTTSARVIIWFGASGDTTYSAGTDQLVWAGSFAPSANSKPGVVIQPSVSLIADTADHILRITTDAGISLDVAAYGHEA